MYLAAYYRLNDLIRKQEDYNWKISQVATEIDDLRAYAENIADSNNLFNSLFTAPTSMYGRQLAYMNASNIFAEGQAAAQMSQLQQNPLYQEEMKKYENNPQALIYRQQQMKNYYIQQARTQFAKHESRLLHEKEKTLLNRKKHLEQSLESTKAQISNCEQHVANDGKSLFGGGQNG